MRLKQEVLVVEHVEALVVDNDKVRGAQDHEEDGLQGGDHHLVDGAGDEDQQHTVGEILKIFLLTEASPRYSNCNLTSGKWVVGESISQTLLVSVSLP